MLVPATVVAEVVYLLERRAGPEVEAPSLAGAGTIPTGARPGDFDTTKD
ncbi:hypothetical protein ACTXG6_32970 [Pseudonocardia sp. Cha107L01]|jgi:hypothetical protein